MSFLRHYTAGDSTEVQVVTELYKEHDIAQTNSNYNYNSNTVQQVPTEYLAAPDNAFSSKASQEFLDAVAKRLNKK